MVLYYTILSSLCSLSKWKGIIFAPTLAPTLNLLILVGMGLLISDPCLILGVLGVGNAKAKKIRSRPGKLNLLERHYKGGSAHGQWALDAHSEHLYREMGQSPELGDLERRPQAVPIATGQAKLWRTLESPLSRPRVQQRPVRFSGPEACTALAVTELELRASDWLRQLGAWPDVHTTGVFLAERKPTWSVPEVQTRRSCRWGFRGLGGLFQDARSRGQGLGVVRED